MMNRSAVLLKRIAELREKAAKGHPVEVTPPVLATPIVTPPKPPVDNIQKKLSELKSPTEKLAFLRSIRKTKTGAENEFHSDSGRKGQGTKERT